MECLAKVGVCRARVDWMDRRRLLVVIESLHCLVDSFKYSSRFCWMIRCVLDVASCEMVVKVSLFGWKEGLWLGLLVRHSTCWSLWVAVACSKD